MSEMGLEFPALQVVGLRAVAGAGFVGGDLFAASGDRG
jgi:hypothetical protein